MVATPIPSWAPTSPMSALPHPVLPPPFKLIEEAIDIFGIRDREKPKNTFKKVSGRKKKERLVVGVDTKRL